MAESVAEPERVELRLKQPKAKAHGPAAKFGNVGLLLPAYRFVDTVAESPTSTSSGRKCNVLHGAKSWRSKYGEGDSIYFSPCQCLLFMRYYGLTPNTEKPVSVSDAGLFVNPLNIFRSVNPALRRDALGRVDELPLVTRS